MNIQQLRRRARRHGLLIHRDRIIATPLYYLVDAARNCVAVPGPIPLETVAEWLNDFDANSGDTK